MRDYVIEWIGQLASSVLSRFKISRVMVGDSGRIMNDGQLEDGLLPNSSIPRPTMGTTSAPPPQPSAAAAELALQVVTSANLLPLITSFLPGVPMWTVEYEHNLGPKTGELTLHERAKMSMGTAGLLPRLAIHHRDITTLARLYELHSQPQFRQKGKFWFAGAMHSAALSGHVDVLQWLNDKTNCKLRSDTVNMAAREGHGDVVRWLWANYPQIEEKVLTQTVERVAKDGHLAVLKVLMERYSEPVGEATNQAAGNGHLDVVVYLCGLRGDACSPATVDRAAAGGHLHVLKWLTEHQSQPFQQAAVYEAVARGHIEVVKFLWEMRSSWKKGDGEEFAFKTGVRNGISHAIHTGDLAMVVFLLEILPDHFPLYALTIAATSGHLEIVKTLYHAGGRPQQDLDEALVSVKRKKCNKEITEFLMDLQGSNAATSEEDTRAPSPQPHQWTPKPYVEATSTKVDVTREQTTPDPAASPDEPPRDPSQPHYAGRRILRVRRK